MNYLRKELYELIKSDESIFDFIQESSLDGLWYWDLTKPEEEWMNAKFWTTLGYDPNKMPHKAAAWQDIIHPDDLALATENVGKHLADPNYPYDQIVRYRHQQGHTVWIRCRGLAIRDEEGNPVRLLGAHNDVTDEKRREQLLVETNRAARVGAWELDAKTNQVYWSDITKEIHEVAPDYVPDLETGINFYKEGYSRTIIQESVEKALMAGKPWDLELQIVTATGKEIWVRAIGRAEFREGTCQRLYGVFQDINDRKLAQISLAESEEQFRQTFDYAVVGMALVSTKGQFIKVNNSFCQMIGYSEAELLNMSFTALSDPETLEESLPPLLELRQGKRDVFLTEKKYRHKKGHFIWVSIAVSKVVNNDGKLLHYITQYSDITERVKSEERQRKLSILEAKSKEMEQFAYIASHDLREPLTTIKGYLELVVEEFAADFPTDARQLLNLALGSANRMDALIHGLLDYSRLGRDRSLEKVDSNELWTTVLEDLSLKIETSKAQITNDSLPVLLAYPLELKLLLQNLLSNAIKFAQPNQPPRIHLGFKKIGDGWQFSLKDNGIGIPESEQKHIFFIFQRLYRNNIEGTGIGLANCKKIAELHRGDIWVDSKLGKGSTFHFTILTEREQV
ncbi:MAG: PAS domain S-box protein [Bacteroidota bacterium]